MQDVDIIKSVFNDPSKENITRIVGEENIIQPQARCKACGKLVSLENMPIIDTGVIKGVTVGLCKDCFDALMKEKLCGIVCMKCKQVRSFVEPQTNPQTGFKMEPGKFYHILDCPACNPEKYENKTVPAIIIEEALYNEKVKKHLIETNKVEEQK